MMRFLGGRRRARELAYATAFAGLAACVKYEAVVMALPLGLLWAIHLRRHREPEALWGLLALVPWLFAGAWMLTHDTARAGDYASLISRQSAAQFPVWFGLSLATLPAVVTWPVAALGVVGLAALFGEGRTRPVAWLLVYLIAAHLATIAVGYNWIARYLLVVLPFVVIPAAIGWSRLPNWAWLRVGVALLALAGCLFLAHQWVRAEKDRWRETILAGRAVARQVPPGARVWSDDPYLTPYWAGRDLMPLSDLAAVKPGDYVLLNDFYGALRQKRTVGKSLSALRAQGGVEVIFETNQEFTPLAGDVIDPQMLAQVADLRALGPQTFHQRRYPIAVRATLVRLTEFPDN